MIKFEISSQIVEVAPNNVAQVNLTVTNSSQIIDFFTVSIEPLISPETMGLYPGWVEFNTPTFSLRPAGDNGRGGDSAQTVIVKVNIPPQVYAGNYAGTILVTARSGADNSVEIPFNIVISQIDAQTFEIQPIESSSRKSAEVYRVVVSNQGNAPHIYSVFAEDPNDDLKFIIDPPEVPLRPGEQAALTLKAQPRQRNWAGDDINHEFKVKMEGSDQEIRGSFKQKAAIAPLHWFGRHWGRFVFFFALLLVLLIVAAIIWLPQLLKPAVSYACAPVSLRTVNVLSNGTTTNILVSGRNGTQPYTSAVTEQSDKLPGIFGSLVSVSPDGRRIAYVTASDLAMNDARIWIKNLDTDQAPIASIPITSGLWPVAPVWSSNGDKLAYVMRRVNPAAATVTATSAAATTPAVGVTGTVTTTTAAVTTAAGTTVSGPPGADAANPSQLDLYVVTDFQQPPPAKALASPPNLVPNLFYGSNIATNPLCWASDDSGLLVSQQTNDGKLAQVALADGKVNVVTPQAGGLSLPKPSIPSLPSLPKDSGLILPLKSLIGVPASFLQVPQAHLAVVQQQTGTGTTTPGATKGTTPGGTGTGTVLTNPANACSIVKPFSQNDPRWADLPLRDGSTNTMAELGCPITGAAILLNYQNVDTNPAELSSCLGNLTSPLNQAGWFAIAQQCGSFKLQGGVRADFSWDLLDSALQKGPTIVGLLGGPSGTHFLVVTGGYQGISTSYTVTDPWDGTTYKTLDYFLSKGYRPRWVISYEGDSAACVTSIPDTTNQLGIRTTGAEDGGLYQQPQPFRFEVTGSNDTASATVRVVNPRLNLDDSSKIIQANETETFSTEGNYTIAITVKDSSGNTALTRNIYFTIDRTAPVLGYRLAPTVDKTTNKSLVPVNVTLQATDDLSGISSIEYQVNGSQWQLYSSDTDRVPLIISDNGTYAINYRATDGAGNTAAAQTINFVIEKPVQSTTTNGGRPITGGTGQVTPTVGPGGTGANGANGGAAGAKTSAPALSVPTVTAVPTATPRPVVKATVTPVPPTTAPPTTVPPTPSVQPTSLLPTGSPEITPTATVPLPTTEVVTPTATIALAPVMVVPQTTLTFPPDNPKQQLTIQNTGNAQLVWTIATGTSNSLVNFSLTTGNVDIGGSVTVDVTLLNPNLTGNDQSTTFSISSNGGGSQTVGVIIKAQPLPVGSVALVPSTTVLSDTNTIQVNLTLPSSNITPNHIDLYATYKGCVDTCVAAPVQIGQSIPYTGNSLTAPWNTTNVVPQSGIILGGNICMNQDCSVYQQLNPLTGLSIDMTAAFSPPSTDNSLAPTTTLNIINRSARTKQVNISIQVDNVVVRQFVANDANGWSVDWDTSLVAPSSTVVIAGQACNSTDSTAVCLDIPSLTGYHTTVGGTVTSIPDLTVAKALTGTISFVVTPTNNVKSVVVNGFYAKSATSSQVVQQAGVATTKDTNNTTFSVNVDTTPWPIQTGITLTVSVCFNQDGTDCTPLAPNPFGGLYIPAGAPATISDNTAEPKYTTVNTNYSTPLSVRVTDSKNNPVNQQQVLFLVDAKTDPAQSQGYTGPSGSFLQSITTYGQNGAIATTDQNGIATIAVGNTLKANNVEGNFVIKVLISGMTDSPTAFIALNNVAPGAKQMNIVQNTDNQTAKIDTKFGSKLQVKLDVAGVQVTFTTQDSGLGAHFTGGASATFTATTDTSGIATAGDLTANVSAAVDKTKLPLVGSYKVRASAPGYTPALFSLSNYVGDPITISVVTASSPGVYDSPMPSVTYTQTIKGVYPNIAALVTDKGGNPLSNVGVVFTSSPTPLPGVTFGNSASVNATVQTGTDTSVQGVAVASGLNANNKIGRNTVTASVVITPNVATPNFIFVNTPGSPSRVAISTLPTTTVKANQAFDSTLQATVYDEGDNPVGNIYNGSPVQVQFNSPAFTDRSLTGGSSVTFSDTTTTVYTATVSGGAGVAQVNVPIIGTCKIGGPFQVNATLILNGAPVNNSTTSTNLSIVQGDPNSFVQHYNNDGNSQYITITNAAGLPFKTKMLDSCNNLLLNSNVVFTAPQVTGPTGNFNTYASGNYSATVSTGASGEATAPAFYANLKASYSSYIVTATAASKPNVSLSFNLHNNPGLPASIVPGGIGSDSTQPLHLTVGSNPTASQVVTATVLDQGGNPVFLPANQTLSDNTKIIFVGNGAPQNVPGANFDSVNNFVYTDANGVITSTTALTTTNKASTNPYAITAHSAVNNGVQAQFFLANDPDVPSKIAVDGVDPANKLYALPVNIKCGNACDNVTERIFNPITVLVTDVHDNPISNSSINFTVNPGTPLSGSNKPSATFGTRPVRDGDDTQNTSYITATDSLGRIKLSDPAVTPSLLYSGFYAGDYNIHVTSASVNGNTTLDTFINFENLPDNIPQAVSIQITTSGNSNPVSAPVTTTVNTSFPELSALVKDANGNGINGKVVTFTVSPPPTSTNVATGIWVTDTTSVNFSTNTQTKNTVPGYATINRNITQPDTPVGSNTDLQANQKVGNFTLTALVAGANNTSITQTITLTNSPQNFILAQGQLTLNQPVSATAKVDNRFAGFTAQLVDQFGNPLPNYPVTFMVPLSSTNPVTTTTGYFVNSDNGDGSSKTVLTDSSGTATITTTLQAGIKAGSFNVSGKVPSIIGSANYFTSTTLITLTNLPGDPDTNHITSSVGSVPQQVKVGDPYNSPITVNIRDKYDNPVPSALVSYTITSLTNGANSTVMNPAQNTNQTTNGAGQTSINSVDTNTKAGTFSVAIHAKGPTATSSIDGAFPIQFVTIPDYPNKVYVVSGNNQTPDVGQTFTQTLVISVTDQYNNPVNSTNPNNQPNQVTFTAPADVPNGGPTAILTDPINGAGTTYTATIGAGGQATLPSTNIQANSQINPAGYNVTLSVPGINSSTLGHLDSFHFTNVADLTLVTTTTQIVQAGGEGFAPLQVKVGGAGGAGVPNITVSFSITSTNLGVFSGSTCQPLNVGSNGSSITVTATTGSDGIASVSNFCAGTQLGGYKVKASTTFGSATQTVWIPLANTANLGITNGDNQSAITNGGTFSDLGVYVTGFGGTNIPGANVTFAVTSTNYAVITPIQPSTTDNNGLAAASLTAGSFVGNYNVTATLLTPSIPLTHTFSLTNTVKVNLATSSQTILAGSDASNGQPQVITATVLDFRNNGVDSVSVTFSSTDTTKGTINSPVTSTSSGGGLATATLKAGTKLGVFNVTATPSKGGVPVGDAASTPATLQMTTSAILVGSTPANPLAGQQGVPVSVTVSGFGGVPLTNIPVAFTISPASPALATIVSTPVSSTNGVAATTLNAAAIAGPYNVIATLDPAQFSPGPAPTVSATIPLVNLVQVDYGNPDTKLLAGGTSSDGTQVLGGSVPVTFTAIGAANTNVSGVTFWLTSTNGLVGAFSGAVNGGTTAGPTDISGQTSKTLIAGKQVGSYSISVVGYVGSTQVTTATVSINALTKGVFLPGTLNYQFQAGGDSQPISVTLTGNTDTNNKTALVSGAPIQYSLDATGTTLASLPITQTATASDGSATINVNTKNLIGVYGVTASLNLPSVPQMWLPNTQTVNVVNTATITSTAAISIPAGTSSVPISATVVGFNNTPIQNARAIFSLGSDASNFADFAGQSQIVVTSTSSGIASTTFNSRLKAGKYTLVAQLDQTPFSTSVWTVPAGINIPVTNTVTFSFTAPTKTNLAAASVSGATDGEPIKFYASITGAGNKAVDNAEIKYEVSDPFKGTLTSAAFQSNSSSSVNFTNTLTAGNTLGSYVVTTTLVSTSDETFVLAAPQVFTATTTAIFSATSGQATPSNPLAGGTSVPISYTVLGYNNHPVQGATVAITTNNTTRANITTASNPTDASGVANLGFATGDQAGPYTITGSLVGNPTPVTKTTNYTNTVSIVSDNAAQPLAGGGSDSMVITALGTGSKKISGVDLAFNYPANGASGRVTGGSYSTGSDGTVSIPLTSTNSYGAWNLGVTPKVGTGNVGSTTTYNVPVTNTLTVTSTTYTNSNPPRPIANGGTVTMTVKVGGYLGYNPGSGVPVTFGTTDVSGNCSGGCGSVTGSANTGTNGEAIATVTATTPTTITATIAQSYNITATVNVGGVANNLQTPILAINTVGLTVTSPIVNALDTDPTHPKIVKVVDNQGNGLAGFTVQFTIVNSAGTIGSTTSDGYLCNTDCTITSTLKYKGAEIRSASDGTAGVNITQTVQAVSPNGTTYQATGPEGANGIKLLQAGPKNNGTQSADFGIEATVLVAYLPTGERGPTQVIDLKPLGALAPPP